MKNRLFSSMVNRSLGQVSWISKVRFDGTFETRSIGDALKTDGCSRRKVILAEFGTHARFDKPLYAGRTKTSSTTTDGSRCHNVR